MKFIEKGEEPQEFTEWKENDSEYLAGRPKWKRLNAAEKKIIRESLIREQGHICCYCESRIVEGNCHIDHIKPKGKAFYPMEQLEYENLICSCQLQIEAGETRTCGNSRGSWYDNELFVSPLDPNCESRFEYTLDGQIKPQDGDLGAERTITRLNLKCDKLNNLREKVISAFIGDNLSADDVENFINGYLTIENGAFNPFYTTIQFLSQDLITLAT